jgi:O-acetyl-ADP-ribose deacetylase (regulator of RNase III)
MNFSQLTDRYTKLSKREKTILLGTTLILAGLFLDRLVIHQIMNRLSTLDRSIREEEAAVKRSLHILVQKNRILAESKELGEFSAAAGDPEEEMTALLKEIEILADRASVNLVYVKPATGADEKGVKRYLASLECESQMEQVAAFFHSIESSPKLLKIEKFSLQPKSRESSLARCTMTVSKTVLS